MTTRKPPLRAGRLLVAVYGILALAAMGRSSYELIAKFDLAPLAYSLSAAAALVYLVATFSLAFDTPTSRRIALIAVLFELTGVLVVGFASLLSPEWFSASGAEIRTVWSYFGIGYGFVPLVLPFLGLLWLLKRK